MKRKFVLAFMVVLLCSMPICLTGQPAIPKLEFTVRVLVNSDKNDQWLNDMVKGYILSALREIPDVKVVGNNEMYTILVIPGRLPNGAGYHAAWLVTRPHVYQLHKSLPEINACFFS